MRRLAVLAVLAVVVAGCGSAGSGMSSDGVVAPSVVDAPLVAGPLRVAMVTDVSGFGVRGSWGYAVLNYNVNTAQVVVQTADGAFVSAWKMSAAQLENVVQRGSLGGG